MGNREEFLDKIVEMEWKMFQNVQNRGGRAQCQDDFKTFEIMRKSQGISWSEGTLESYLNDLNEAKRTGRNLITEKYARMMKSTAPSEYARITHMIPQVDTEVVSLIDKIAEIMIAWEEELSEKYSYVVERGRPLRSSEDSPLVTSLETYLRAELETYSKKTIELYYENIMNQNAEDVNGAKITLDYMVKQYGYESLEEANEKMRSR
ncbi:MAG: DUF4125 family protein [Thermodesulfobacteriota bacterium]|nr:DUF4125 family protein [Thermodesulfobacteriota bacterium]